MCIMGMRSGTTTQNRACVEPNYLLQAGKDLLSTKGGQLQARELSVVTVNDHLEHTMLPLVIK